MKSTELKSKTKEAWLLKEQDFELTMIQMEMEMLDFSFAYLLLKIAIFRSPSVLRKSIADYLIKSS